MVVQYHDKNVRELKRIMFVEVCVCVCVCGYSPVKAFVLNFYYFNVYFN